MFIHCHRCNWSQDDFWDKSYNPWRFFWRQMFPAWFSRFPNPHCQGVRYRARLIAHDLWHLVNPSRYWRQRWWTYKAWQKALRNKRGGCPKCGNNLCLD